MIRATTTLEDFALITHAVPAERVRRAIPEGSGFEVQTFTSPEGEVLTRISVGCGYYRGYGFSGIPVPRLSFGQVNYLAYVRYRGKPGVFVMASFVGSLRARFFKSLLVPSVHSGRFRAEKELTPGGYDLLACELRAEGSLGETRIRLKAHGRGSNVAERTLGYHLLRGGIRAEQEFEHDRMRVMPGTLIEGRFDYWETLGILKPEEVLTPVSVLVSPKTKVRILNHLRV